MRAVVWVHGLVIDLLGVVVRLLLCELHGELVFAQPAELLYRVDRSLLALHVEERCGQDGAKRETLLL